MTISSSEAGSIPCDEKNLATHAVFVDELKGSLQHAASKNHMDVIRIVLSQEEPGANDLEDIILQAIQHKDLRMVQFLHDLRVRGFTKKAMDHAARVGSLAIVRWLHETRHEGCTQQAMDSAAEEGYLPIVKFLHLHRIEGCTTHAMDAAACNGHLQVVRFLHANRRERFTRQALDHAASQGHLEVVRFLFVARCNLGQSRQMASRHSLSLEDAMDLAATSGHLDVLRFLVACRHDKIPQSVLNQVAGFGHVHVVQWLILYHHQQQSRQGADPRSGFDFQEALRRATCATTFLNPIGRQQCVQVLQEWLSRHANVSCLNSMHGQCLYGV